MNITSISRDSVTRFFASGSFYESSSPKPLKITLEILASQGAPPVSTTPATNLSSVLTTPVANLLLVSTKQVVNLPPVSNTPAANFATGTTDTGSKFVTGSVDTGGK
jgi:hypothetical protein